MSSDQIDITGANILVVEDNPADLDLITKILSKQGYTVRPVSRGSLALSAVQEAPPDLILLDVMMPEMSGHEVCEQLKADDRTRNIPIIFLSVLSDVFDKVKAFSVGGIDYITKPYQMKEVLARVQTHLTLQHLQRRLQEDNLRLQQEITEREETEHLLRVSERRLRSIFRNVSFGIFQATPDGRIITANPELARMLGYSSVQELLNSVTNIAEQLYLDPQHWYGVTEIVQETEEEARVETRLRYKDGGEILVFLNIWVVRNEEGDIHYFEGSFENITERKRIEKAITTQLSLLSEIFNGVQEGISFVDADNTIIFCNPACGSIFEEDIDHLIGKNLLEFFDEQAQTTIVRQQEKLRKGRVLTYEIPLTTAQGNRKYIRVTASPRFDEEGSCIGTFDALFDITARKQAEEQLAAQKVELKKLNASKDTFFSIIAHDLKNPFSGLLGITDFIVKNIEQFSPEDIQENVASLRDSAEIVYTLIENLLAWSRLQRGVMEHHPERISLDEIAKHNILLFTPIAEQKQISLVNQVPEGTMVYADRNMIDTVIRNLTSNALKFTHPGGIIAVSAISKRKYVELSISDTGTGIPEEDIPKLFQIDRKYSNPGTAGEEGTGLGLILCKDLIERNNGRIWVESEVGQGTVFTIRLQKKPSSR